MSASTASTATVPQAPDRDRMNRLGLGLFLLSEAFLFLVLIASRFLLDGTATPDAVNQGLGLLLTVLLLSSSVTAHVGHRAVRAAQTDRARLWFAATMALATVFLVLVVFEWRAALVEFPVGTIYGSLFFLITGAHALHLLIGIGAVGSVRLHLRKGLAGPDRHWGVEAVVWYWHYVDAVWLAVFTTLYLVS